MQVLRTYLKNSDTELLISNYTIIQFFLIIICINTATESKYTHKAILILSLKRTQVPKREHILNCSTYNDQRIYIFKVTNMFIVK